MTGPSNCVGRVGCSTISFSGDPLPVALERIARLAFQEIELGVVGPFCPHYQPYPADPRLRRETVEAIRASGLRVSAVNGVPSLCVPERGDLDQIHAATLELLALSADLQAGLILPGSFAPGAADNPAGSARELAAAFRRGRQEFGVEVSVEAPHKGSVAETVGDTLRLLELTGSDELGIAYDCSHIVSGGSNAVDSLRALGPKIRHVHARDARGEDIHFTPGDGDYDWPYLVDYLRSTGFDNPLTLELEYAGRLTVEEVASEALRAREYLGSIGVASA